MRRWIEEGIRLVTQKRSQESMSAAVTNIEKDEGYEEFDFPQLEMNRVEVLKIQAGYILSINPKITNPVELLDLVPQVNALQYHLLGEGHEFSEDEVLAMFAQLLPQRESFSYLQIVNLFRKLNMWVPMKLTNVP